ncbi:YezD family protein [candidate division TA06 bacterium]|nr:YezD family protein [candidate division TA06 bacterium]
MPEKNKNFSDTKILDEILAAIHNINYGEILITIHDSKIVQIEKREKRRFIPKGGT